MLRARNKHKRRNACLIAWLRIQSGVSRARGRAREKHVQSAKSSKVLLGLVWPFGPPALRGETKGNSRRRTLSMRRALALGCTFLIRGSLRRGYRYRSFSMAAQSAAARTATDSERKKALRIQIGDTLAALGEEEMREQSRCSSHVLCVRVQ